MAARVTLACAALAFAIGTAAYTSASAQEGETAPEAAVRGMDEQAAEPAGRNGASDGGLDPAPEPVVSAPASAQLQRRKRGLEGSYFAVGVNPALTLGRTTGSGFSLGAEASLVTLFESQFWRGAYVDATYGFAADECRLSLGPEIGLGFVGVDLGYLLKLGNGPTAHGIVVRPMLSLGLLTLYVRAGWLFGDQADGFSEVGLLIKLPVPLD